MLTRHHSRPDRTARRVRARTARRAAPPLGILAAACLAVLVAPLLMCPPAAADPGEITVITATKAPTTLAELRAASRTTRRQMRRLEARMRVILADYQKARARLTAISADLADVRLQLVRSQSELDAQADLVGARLEAMYKLGEYTWLDIILNSDSLADARAQYEFFGLLIEQDQREGDCLASLNERVDALEAAIATNRQEALEVEQQIDAQRRDLEDAIAQRQALLAELTTKIEKILAGKGAGTPLSRVSLDRRSYTQFTWAKALLQQLRMPLTGQNVAALVAWEMAEGGHWHNTAHYNPLNTTQPMPGATAMNSVGVKAYGSWAQGFRATIITLHNGYYGGILRALRAGDDAVAVAHAVAASPWGTGNFASLIE